MFIARALGETEQIAFGTGVVLLHLHDPVQVAHRIAMLDHLAKGRFMFGIGSGGTPSDAEMLRIESEPEALRGRMTEAVDMIAAIREAIGYGIDLGVEIHRNLQPDEAITLARALEPYRLKYYEDPLAPESDEAHRYIARHIDIPMALGERNFLVKQFKELIDSQIAAFIRPDLSLTGGFTQIKKVAAIAEPAMVQLFPHLMGSPVNNAAFAHLAAAIPNYYVTEVNAHTDEQLSLVDQPFVTVDGFREIPDRPGIGVEIDEEACARLPFKERPMGGFFHNDGSVAH